MYSRDITDSDSFTSLTAAAQALYFHLNQGADDDGMNNQVRTAMRRSHTSVRELRALEQAGWIIRFDSGVVAICHWKIHNTLRKDRYTPTSCSREWNLICADSRGIYTLAEQQRLPDGCQTVAGWLPDGCHRKEKIRSDKISLDKGSIVDAGRSPDAGPGGTPWPPENPQGNKSFHRPTLEQVRQYCRERRSSVDPQRWFDYYTANGWMMGRSPMRDWQAALRTWESGNRGTGAAEGGFLEIMEELDE